MPPSIFATGKPLKMFLGKGPEQMTTATQPIYLEQDEVEFQ